MMLARTLLVATSGVTMAACGAQFDGPPARPIAVAPLDAGTPPPASVDAGIPVEETTAPKTIVARHVLVQWMGSERVDPAVVRNREQARAVAEEVLRRVRAGEDFARLVVEFSDEPRAGARGGSLGRFGRGVMAPAFEEAAFALKRGQISGVVESSFGFHVIERLE
jgi:hypothetical protein